MAGTGELPPVIESIAPNEVIEKPVPQPQLVIVGENLRQPGVFDSSGNPTVTIEHTALAGVSFSAVASTNFGGTQATIPSGLNHFNMLQMPLGEYDLTLARPDGTSTTVVGGFSLIEEPAPEPGEIRMTIASHWGGPVTGADVHGDYAYIANGRRLVIVDVSHESNPVEIGSLSQGLYWPVRDVKVRDGYAFVVGGASIVSRHFHVVDVADPSSPELMWVGAASHESTTVCLRDEYAYTMGEGQTRKFDISDPLNVINLGNTATTDECAPEPMPEIEGWHSPSHLKQMKKVGDLLYVSDTHGGFTILDVADPGAPEIVGIYMAEVTDPGWPIENLGIDVAGQFAYLAAGRHGLQVADISDPSQPTFVAYFALPQAPGYPPPDGSASAFHGLAVRDGLAYIGYTYGFISGPSQFVGAFLLTLDVSDPNEISIVNMFNYVGGYAFTSVALGDTDTAFVGGSASSSLASKEHYLGAVSTPAPVLVNEVSPNCVTDLAWSDKTLYVTRGGPSGPCGDDNGLFIRDVSDAANPVLLAHVNPGTRQLAIDAQYDRIYVLHYGTSVTSFNNLSLYDASNAANPIVLDHTDIGLANEAGTNLILASEPQVYVTNSGGSGNIPYGLTIVTVHGTEPKCTVGDLDCDGVVDVTDLLVLLGEWGPCASCDDCPADLNGDCNININDLLLLLANWG